MVSTLFGMKVSCWHRKNATTGDESSGALSQQHELAFVKSSCRALRCIRLSDKVVTDHLIDRYSLNFANRTLMSWAQCCIFYFGSLDEY